MQLSGTFSLLTLVSIASAAKSFGLLTIRSGSNLQYNSVVSSGNDFVASGASDGPTFILNDDGSLVDSDNKKYITISDKKFSTTDKADKQFSISENTNLAYKGSTSFAVASDLKITVGDGTSVVLYLAAQKDVSNLYPGAASSSKSAAPTSTSKAAATTTKAATTVTTSTAKASAKPTEAAAPKGEFGVIAIASGTKFQNAAIKKVDSHPHVFSVAGNEGKDLELTLKSDGTLVDQDGRGVNLDSNAGELGSVAPFGREAPTKGFSIADGHLVHDGNHNWFVVPSGDDKYSLSNKNSIGATGIVLHVVEGK